MACYPFRTATLVDNETIEGQIGEGCMEGDGKVDEEVVLEVALKSSRAYIHQGYLRSGVDFTDVTLVYEDANQDKAHKIIIS